MDIRPIDANALKQHQKMLVEHMDGYDIAYNTVPMHKVDDLPTLSLNTLRDAIYQDAVVHGLWEGKDDLPNQTKVVIDEVKEMLDASVEIIASAGRRSKKRQRKKKHFAEELADVVISCFSLAGKRGIDIDAAIRRKMEINKQRPWKHGKND